MGQESKKTGKFWLLIIWEYFKKSFLIIVGTVFVILGIIGLLLPVIPQIPFFLVGLFLLMAGSKEVHDYCVNSKIYRKYIAERAEHYREKFREKKAGKTGKI